MKRDNSLRTGGWGAIYGVGRALLGCGLLILLGLGIFSVGRLAWADHLSRSAHLSDRLYATRLFPSATLYDRLAQKREDSGGDSIPDLQQAVALEPENALWRIRLGLRAEIAGDYALAECQLLKAAQLSRLYQPRYLLAQYYFRRQNADHFHEWSREAFATAYGDIAPLLELSWRMQPDAEWLSRQAPAGRPEIGAQFLLFLGRLHQTARARSLALTLAGAARREDLPALLQYCNLSLYDGNASAAVDTWNLLCARGLLPYSSLDPQHGTSLTNARFEHLPLDTGFDWRIHRAPWVTFAPQAGGMRVTLSGNQPENCALASQYLALRAGTRYRLRLIPVVGQNRMDALEWNVVDTMGKIVASQRSADGWHTFTAPAEVVRLDLLYRRPVGSTRLNGTIYLAGVQLEWAP